MGFAAIIVGDESLSGRRADRHVGKAVELLQARGLDLAWVLEPRYAHLHHVARRGEASVIVHFNSESRLLDLMERIEADWPGVRVFSLPASAGTAPRPQIELGVKGDPDQVAPAMDAIRLELARRSIAWDEPPK
jgi:molybdopterin-biosynthesis enzyme MoeA-like protein